MGWVKEHKIQLTIFYARLGYVTLGTVSFTGIGPAELAWHKENRLLKAIIKKEDWGRQNSNVTIRYLFTTDLREEWV